MDQRFHVWFSGRVQGVGFRYTCVQQARRYDVVGWVKNLDDGDVEMIVEGQPSEVEAYLESVASATHGAVPDTRIVRSKATGQFSGMSVLH